MIINLCCSASSGSTFLSHLLNRHPDIVSGDELRLFSKPFVYDHFGLFKKKSFFIRRLGLSSSPYNPDQSIFWNLRSYQLSDHVVWSWVRESEDICQLAEKFHQHILNITHKTKWAEKTPANIYCIDRFIKMFPDAKVLHIVRDPRDVILTQMKRGVSMEYAAENWLTAVAAIQNCNHNANILEIRYEDLVLHKEVTLQEICRHLSVDFHMDYFIKDEHCSRGIEKSDQWDTWNLSPDEGFSDKSIGKYKNENVDFQVASSMKLTKGFADLLGIKEYSLPELARQYQYDVVESNKMDFQGRNVTVRKGQSMKQYIGYQLGRVLISNEQIIERATF